MDILYITPYVPSPIRVRPYNLIRTLARHNHHVTLAALWERPEERQVLEEFRSQGVDIIAAPLALKRRIWNGLRALGSSMPLQAAYCDVPAFRQMILAACLSRPFDVVHVEHLRGAEYGVWLKARMRSRQLDKPIPIVWDSVDCISYLFEQAARQSKSLRTRWMAQVELGRTRRYESRMAGQFDHMLVTSRIDKSAFEALVNSRAPISVLSNGVDLEYFHPGESARQPDTIVFSGKMSYHANVTAALYVANQVMPLVWAQRPGTRLVIAGNRPPSSVQKLATIFPGHVVVTGYLPDMRRPLQEAAVSAAPLLYGAGVQNKVLEAMACGTPVVATSRSLAALDVKSGADCLVADTAETFAAALLSLLSDVALRTRLGEAGRRYVEANHDWHTIIAQLTSIYEGLLAPFIEPARHPPPAW
jgi:glycosyltransferase involved in cell wall biosynthesis